MTRGKTGTKSERRGDFVSGWDSRRDIENTILTFNKVVSQKTQKDQKGRGEPYYRGSTDSDQQRSLPVSATS